MAETAIIVGAGRGISASVARACAREGMQVVLAARDTRKLAALAGEIGATAETCDTSQPDAVAALFAAVDKRHGPPDFVLFNASYGYRGPFLERDPAEVRRALEVGAFGGFLVAQEAIRRMLPRQSGSLFFTGATASVKGFPNSAPFAMQKFALRGLAQSLAREYSPQGIHVAHFVIDGGVATGREAGGDPPDRWLDPDAIAATYMAVHRQHRSAWTWEIELRPWVERF